MANHTEPQKPPFSLDEQGYKVRNAHFQWILGGMSHSAFNSRKRRKDFPKPDGKDPRPFWWSQTVTAFLPNLKRKPWDSYPPKAGEVVLH